MTSKENINKVVSKHGIQSVGWAIFLYLGADYLDRNATAIEGLAKETQSLKSNVAVLNVKMDKVYRLDERVSALEKASYQKISQEK